MMSLYRELQQAGCELDSHESDLYVTATSTAIAIVKSSGRSHAMFRSAVDGKQWLDVPFAYEPFWDRVKARGA